MIDLLLLGTGAMMPMPNRWLSCLLARCRGEITLFDCGEGTQIPWKTTNWGFRTVSAVCLSHLHADHVAGLPGILHSLANSERTETLSIYGPPGTVEVVTGLRVIATQLPFDVAVHELEAGDQIALPGGMTGRVIAGDHRVPSLIYRVDVARAPRFDRAAAEALGVPVTGWRALQRGERVEVGARTIESHQVLGPNRRGVSFAYMTDTRPVPDAAAFLREVDLLVSEGTYGESEMMDKAIARKHMTFAEAAAVARDAEAGELWLTHFSPAMERPEKHLGNATAIFPRSVVGFTGLTTTLTFADR